MRYRDHRFPADKELKVLLQDEVRQASFIDISSTGARLSKLAQLPKDAVVTLCQMQMRIQAKVVWSNERHTGVHFLRPLTPFEVSALRGAAGHGFGTGHQGLRELS